MDLRVFAQTLTKSLATMSKAQMLECRKDEEITAKVFS